MSDKTSAIALGGIGAIHRLVKKTGLFDRIDGKLQRGSTPALKADEGRHGSGAATMVSMRVARGKVVGNTVVLDEPLPEGKSFEGSPVTVYLEEDGWVLDEASTQELVEAIAECERGEVFSTEEVFAGLPPRK